MSYTKILADKDYGNYLIDKCYQDEPFKFHDNNKSYADLKDLNLNDIWKMIFKAFGTCLGASWILEN